MVLGSGPSQNRQLGTSIRFRIQIPKIFLSLSVSVSVSCLLTMVGMECR